MFPPEPAGKGMPFPSEPDLDATLNMEDDMKLDEVREMAKKLGVSVGRLKKSDLVRGIQRAEGVDACFETGSAQCCGQDACLWRADCV